MNIIFGWNERWLGILACFWAAILLWYGNVFEGLERYRLIGEFFPDWAWGLMYLICGITLILPVPIWWKQQAHIGLCIVWLGMFILSLLATIVLPALLIASLCLAVAMIHVGKFWRYSQVISALNRVK